MQFHSPGAQMDAAADAYDSRRLCLSQSLCCVLLRSPHYTISVFRFFISLSASVHAAFLAASPLQNIFFSSLKQALTVSRR